MTVYDGSGYGSTAQHCWSRAVLQQIYSLRPKEHLPYRSYICYRGAIVKLLIGHIKLQTRSESFNF